MMKTLTKIKLINWHIFDNHTIDIKNNTLITGENGHGKSTLLDAINFVLSGASGKFNQAANTFAKRTVESYVKGKIGIEGKTYLRDRDNLISHIALEFHDKNTNKYLVIGVVFELPLRKNHGVFYHISDSPIVENYYIRDQKILGLKQFEASVSSSGKIIKTFDTITEIKGMIKSTLGLSNDKYFELLPKALAFSPINDVNKFVYDFLLPEDNVDIEALKTNFHSYREISKQLMIEKEKLDALLPLENESSLLHKVKTNINILKHLEVEIKMESIKKSIENEMIKENNAKKNIQELNEIKSEFNRQINEVETGIRKLENNDILQRIHELEEQIKIDKENIKDINNRINSLMDNLQRVSRLAKNLGIDFLGVKHANKDDFSLLLEDIESHQNNLDQLRTQILIDIDKINLDLSSKASEIKQLEKEIDKLKSNKFTYPEHVEKLLNILKEELVLEFNYSDINVNPLCELLKIEPENEKWRNAVEGYLNTQRFDIIVEPKYFDKALEIYDKHKFKKRIHGVGLINTNKLTGYIAEENSLATKVTGLNEYSRQAVNMLMGKVICVNDIYELKNHNQSITETGMTYRNNTARQINQEVWSKPYIGLEAIKTQLENAIKSHKELTNIINNLLESKKQFESKLELIKQSNIMDLYNIPNYFADQYSLNKGLIDRENELKTLKLDNAWFEVSALIEKLKNEKEILNQKKDDIIGKITLSDNEINDAIKNQKTYQDQLKTITEEFNNLPSISDLQIALEEKKTELFKNYHSKYDRILDLIRNELNSSEKSQQEIEYKIIELMKNFIVKFDNGQLLANINNLNEFLELLLKIRNRNIIEYQDKADTALKLCEKSFKEDFLSQLRYKIEKAKNGFNDLNRALRSKPFGSDEEIFYFTCDASKDPDFRDYYIILDSYQDYESRSLLVETLSQKNLILLRNLFDTLISEDKTEKQVKRIQEYTDYRKYMSYDIKITNRNGEVYFFSKVNREKSGGETQTPFYVIIASSFQQLLDIKKRNRSSACVVMFDEAFNNMDESRIEAMMKYYDELNIQLLIAVPPQRLVNILPYVDTTLGLIKTNNTVVVSSYKYVAEEVKNETVR